MNEEQLMELEDKILKMISSSIGCSLTTTFTILIDIASACIASAADDQKGEICALSYDFIQAFTEKTNVILDIIEAKQEAVEAKKN